MRRERHPTPEEFGKLLAWLDADADEAGRNFNLIHTRLAKVFAARGCIDAESLADEVINRVAVRIDTAQTNYPDPLRCFLGFVEYVYLEHMRDQQKRLAENDPPAPRPTEELEKEDICLTECLERLTQPERDLFERYFGAEKRVRISARKGLGAALQLTPNALRIRAHHLRKDMHLCIVKCISQVNFRNN